MRISIDRGRAGIHIKFSNGYTASIQWGPGTHSDNKELPIYGPSSDLEKNWKEYTERCATEGSSTVEMAVITPGNRLMELPEEFGAGGTVTYFTPVERIPAFLEWVRGL